MKRLVICGFMGTGKTVCGRNVAKELKLDFIDVDEEIEKRFSRTINEIFSIYGEKKFREVESEVIKSLPQSDVVVAVGGGAVINEKNIEGIKKNSIVICLWASPETIFERLKKHENRPLLKGNKYETIIKLLEFRKPYYNLAADFHIQTDNKSILEVVDEILRIYEENK